MKDLGDWLDPITYRYICRRILLNLDLASLKSARLVCRHWDRLVMEEVWGSREGRMEVEKKLDDHWRHGQPRGYQIELYDMHVPFLGHDPWTMTKADCDDTSLMIIAREPRSSWCHFLRLYSMQDLSLVYDRQIENSYQDGKYPREDFYLAALG